MTNPFEVDVGGDIEVPETERKSAAELLGLSEEKEETVEEREVESMANNANVWEFLNAEGNMVVDAPRDLWDACGHFKLSFEVLLASEVEDVLAACNELFSELRDEYGVEEEEEEQDSGRSRRSSGRSSRRSSSSRSEKRSSRRSGSQRSGGNDREDGDFSDLDDSVGSITDGQLGFIENLANDLNWSLGGALDWYADNVDDNIPVEADDLSKAEASDIIQALQNERGS